MPLENEESYGADVNPSYSFQSSPDDLKPDAELFQPVHKFRRKENKYISSASLVF